MKKNKISEETKIPINMSYKELETGTGKQDATKLTQKGYKIVATKDAQGGQSTGNSDVSGDMSTTTSSSSTVYEEDGMGEPVEVPNQDVPPVEPVQVDAVIQPQDPETIKYLSNVRDEKSGEISKPFTIADKRYQMVRGLKSNHEIILAVICLDEMGPDGKNMIHTSEDFERNVARPALEEEQKLAEIEKKQSSLNLGQRKHYLVNQESGNFRSFETVNELAEAQMVAGEQYMGIREFKKFFENKVFGNNKRQISMVNEVTPTGQETDEEMNAKAKKLMVMIRKKIPENIISSIKTPIAKREVIAAFAEMIGVPRANLPILIGSLKDMAVTNQQAQQAKQAQPVATQPAHPAPAQPAQQVVERKIITKKQFSESIKNKK